MGYISGGQGGSLVCGERTLTVDDGAVIKVAVRPDLGHSWELEKAMIEAVKNIVLSRSSKVKMAAFFKEQEEDEVRFSVICLITVGWNTPIRCLYTCSDTPIL